MISEKDKLFLSHIAETIDRIESSLKGIGKNKFLSDYDKQDSTLRRFEIIGEAANNLSEEFKSSHKTIDWRKIIDMRNRVIHGYFDVDLEMVWDTSIKDIPILKKAIEAIIPTI